MANFQNELKTFAVVVVTRPLDACGERRFPVSSS